MAGIARYLWTPSKIRLWEANTQVKIIKRKAMAGPKKRYKLENLSLSPKTQFIKQDRLQDMISAPINAGFINMGSKFNLSEASIEKWWLAKMKTIMPSIKEEREVKNRNLAGFLVIKKLKKIVKIKNRKNRPKKNPKYATRLSIIFLLDPINPQYSLGKNKLPKAIKGVSMIDQFPSNIFWKTPLELTKKPGMSPKGLSPINILNSSIITNGSKNTAILIKETLITA